MAAKIMTKVHLLTGYVNVAGAHRTFCGKFGWEEDGDEFTDNINRRFAATERRDKTTCDSCLRVAWR